jgi:uncharacterized membrane protein
VSLARRSPALARRDTLHWSIRMTNELKAILFLHILSAMVMVGGIIGFVVLLMRARGAADAANVRATAGSAALLNRALVIPGAALAGILGMLLMLRYDQEGIFDAGKQGWIHGSILLWLISLGIAGFVSRFTRRAVSDAGGAGDGGGVRAALSRGPLAILAWANVLVALVILYFMVFQPFVTS